MKVILKNLLLTGVLLLSLPFVSSAHVLKHDSSVGAIMHISPDDDPIIGQISTVYFDIKDKDNKFTPEKCFCAFKVLKDDAEVYSQLLFQNSNLKAEADYTFTEKGDYTIELDGDPKNEEDFDEFDFKFPVHVEREIKPVPKVNHFWHYILIGGAALVALSMIGYDFVKNKDYYTKKFHLK